jgi:hypothetical protein
MVVRGLFEGMVDERCVGSVKIRSERLGRMRKYLYPRRWLGALARPSIRTIAE